MNKAARDGRQSLLKLLRFLLWYAAAMAAVFYLLPWAGSVLEHQYDALSSNARLSVIALFFVAVAGWQFLSWLNHPRKRRQSNAENPAKEPKATHG